MYIIVEVEGNSVNIKVEVKVQGLKHETYRRNYKLHLAKPLGAGSK